MKKTTRISYRTYLRSVGVKPIRTSAPQPRGNGHVELLPGGKVGIWRDGRMELRQRS